MTPAIALLTIGYILVVAGIKNRNVVDVVLGRKTRKSDGNVSDFASGGSFGGGTFTDAPPTNSHAGTAQIDGKPVALWIVPYVKWARNHGWQGKVTSGYRPPWQVVTPSIGLPVAPQGHSNHSGVMFPSGAIDVSDPSQFERALHTFPGPVPLKRDPSIGDPVHFSSTGK